MAGVCRAAASSFPPAPREGALIAWARSSTSTTRRASCWPPASTSWPTRSRVTLGPKGRNVVLERLTGAPIITNDGVSIAREIELSNPLKNMGAQLVREVANKTSDLTGDGTTTATLLAQAIIREGMKALEEGANPMLLRRGIEDATELVVAELRRGARIVDGPRRPHARRDDRGQGGRADRRRGRPARSTASGPRASSRSRRRSCRGSRWSSSRACHVENGHFSPYLIQDTQRMETVFDDPYILLTNKPIAHIQDLMPTLDAVMKSPRPLVIFAEKVEGAALGLLVQNNQHGTLKAVVVRAPGLRPSPDRPPPRPGRLHRRPGDRRGGRPHPPARQARDVRQRAARRDHRGRHGARRGRGDRRSRSRRGCRRSGSSSSGPPRTPTSRCCASAWPSCRAAWR